MTQPPGQAARSGFPSPAFPRCWPLPAPHRGVTVPALVRYVSLRALCLPLTGPLCSPLCLTRSAVCGSWYLSPRAPAYLLILSPSVPVSDAFLSLCLSTRLCAAVSVCVSAWLLSRSFVWVCLCITCVITCVSAHALLCLPYMFLNRVRETLERLTLLTPPLTPLNPEALLDQ